MTYELHFCMYEAYSVSTVPKCRNVVLIKHFIFWKEVALVV